MKRILVGLLIGAVTGSAVVWIGMAVFARKTTLTRLSPDETRRASLVESEWLIHERNFQVCLEDLVDGTSTILLHSPDEGRPYGSERLVWSKDGKWLLLVGRHFFVKHDFFLDNGDQVYFLYHLPSKKGWINSDGSAEWSALAPATFEGIEFTEPIHLKPA